MTETRALTLVPTEQESQAAMSVAKTFVESGYWSDIKTVAQAFVKVQAGREWGIPPFAAMSAVQVIQGKPSLSAQAIASRIKSSGKYDFRVTRLDAEACEIQFYEAGKPIGVSSFTMQDAKAAGMTGGMYTKYARNMLFARAVSNGARWYASDVFMGAAVYTPEELGAEVDGESGEIITTSGAHGPSSVRVVEPSRPAQPNVRPSAAVQHPPVTATPAAPANGHRPSAIEQAFPAAVAVVEAEVVEGEVVTDEANAIPDAVREAGGEYVDAYVQIRKSLNGAATLDALRAEWPGVTAYLVSLGAPKAVGMAVNALKDARRAEIERAA